MARPQKWAGLSFEGRDVMRAGVVRSLIAACVALTIGSVTGAAAAGLGMSSAGFAADSSSVGRCDSDGVTASYTVNLGNVVSVVVDGIAAGCSGAQLNLTLVNGADAGIATGGPSLVTGSSVTVPVTPQPAHANVAGVHIVLVGP